MTLAFFCAASFGGKRDAFHAHFAYPPPLLTPKAFFDRFPDREVITGTIRALAPLFENEGIDRAQPSIPVEIQLLEKSLALKADLHADGLLVAFDTALVYPLALDWKQRPYYDSLLSFDENKVLVSIPDAMQDMSEILRQLWYFSCRGYVPVVMHTEQLLGRFSEAFLLRMKDTGCAFQMDLMALTTFYGKKVQEQAKVLLSANMINYVTADFQAEQFAGRQSRALHHPYMVAYLKDASLCNRYYNQLVVVYDLAGGIKKPSLLSFL